MLMRFKFLFDWYHFYLIIWLILRSQGRAKAAPNPPVGGGPSQNGGPTFYFTTTTLKVGIVDQC